MKIPSPILGAFAAVCMLGAALPNPASAQVSTDDFNALKKMVEQLNDKVQKLEQTHEQDQKAHEQDQQVIQQLQQQAVETKAAVTNAQQTADNAAKAQSASPAPSVSEGPMHNFTMVGDAEAQFGKTAGQHGTFALADFAPIFLFRGSDNVLFEAGFDVTLGNNSDINGNRAPGSSTSVSMSFGQLDYLVNDYVTLVAGDILLPLGTYSERGAGWLNKIPDNPLVRDNLLPGSGVGAQLRGAVPIGESGMMATYSIYGVNGPSSGASNSLANASALDFGGNVGDTQNWHAKPSGGGRLAIFIPYPSKPHYDFELGLSGQTGTWSDSGDHQCGIFDEISYGLQAHDNVIVGNGYAATAGGWGARAGISLSSSPGSVIERNLIAGNREGFNFREQTRTTPRIGGKAEQPVWNHDETIRRNIIAFNRDAQIWGWFDMKDGRHWPAIGKEKTEGLTLEKLRLSFMENVYFAGPGQGWVEWGVNWGRHKSYSTLKDFQTDLGIDQGSRVLDPAFADLNALDCRLTPEKMITLRQIYPKEPVPGVILGEQP